MADTHYIVVFDDEQSACWPMCWDEDCKGALCAPTWPESRTNIALFTSRAAARKAIRVSTAYARLCVEQGEPANDDFLEGHKHVRVVACRSEKP